MINNIFDDTGFNAVKKGLDVSYLRNKVISENIANISTPGYSASTVKFEELLSEKVGFKLSGTQTNPMHLPIGKSNTDVENVDPVLESTNDPVAPGKVNNVDIDHEIVNMTKNSLDWDTYVDLISFKYRLLSASIKEQV